MKMRVSSSRKSALIAVLVGIPIFAFFFLTLLRSNTGTAREATDARESVLGNAADKAFPGQSEAKVLDAYGKLPLAFERNLGQSDARVKYLTHGNGYELFLTPKEAVLALWQPQPHSVSNRLSPKLIRPSESPKASVLRLELRGANPSPDIEGMNPLDRKSNYFKGNDRKNWVTNLPSYGRVEYRRVYPGIDLAFYGNQRRLEYDFEVSPGADPNLIALKLAGSKKIRIDSRGNLVVDVPSGNVSFKKPLIYQMNARGERQEIAGGYMLAKDGEFQFAVSAYDRAQPLVIDPVLDYSTYLGGSPSPGDIGFGVAVDANGNAFVTGVTYNASFRLSSSPATTVGLGTPDANIATNGGAFVSEIDPTGTKELYFSYLSGDGGEVGYSIAVDPTANTTCMNSGNPGFCVYVTGQTFSDNFPVNSTVTPYNNTAPTGGAPTGGNAFITKLNPYVSGNTSLLYSSYLASSNAGDVGHGIAVDSSQNAYITGLALAGPGAVPNFPILNGAQTTAPPAAGNAFLTVLNTTASTNALLYSTYLGGDDANVGTSTLGLGDIGWAVAVDASKVAYIVGTTPSSNFPNLNSTSIFPSIKGWAAAPAGNTKGSAFVSALKTTVSGVNSLVYSTYVGGAKAELGNAIALGGNGIVFITGQTLSLNFFTTPPSGTVSGQFPSPAATSGVAFITKLNTTVSGTPTYSVLLGGNNGDTGNNIQVDAAGNVIVVGTAQSSNFPTTPGAFKTALGSSVAGNAFVSKLNPGGNGGADLLYSTYFGGSGATSLPDQGNGVALDSLGNVYVAGQTYSTDLPVSAGAFQTSLPGGALSAAYVAKLTLLPVLAFGSPCSITQAPPASCLLAFGIQAFHVASAPMTFTLTNNTGSAITLTIPLSAITGTNSADFSAAPASSGGTAACVSSLAAGASCAIGVTFTPSTSGAELATLPVAYTYNNGTVTPAAGSQTVSLTGTGAGQPTVTLNPATTLTFGSQPTGTTSSSLPVTVSNGGSGNLVLTAAPAISGTNAGDFAIASGTTCANGGTVVPTASCTINITFAPGAVGARGPATLTIADNAGNSPQTITITGTGVPPAPVANVSPSTLAFANQLVTTTSAAQAVSVKNTGNANLNITAAPSLSGTNASDFAIASGTTCTNGATVAANATCVINVTFTPPAGASGSRAATLNIADNAAGSPQTVTLTGTAGDFTLSAAPATVNAGATATIAVTVGSVGGFTGAVTLSCSGTIPQGSCTAPSSAVTAPGTGSVTVSTQSFLVPPAPTRRPPMPMHRVFLIAFALLLLSILPVTRRFWTRLGLAGAAALLIVVVGCSSKSNASSTPAGTYSVAITGTSGSVSHTVTVNVTVN